MFSLKHIILFNVPYFFMVLLTTVTLGGVEPTDENETLFYKFSGEGSMAQIVEFDGAETPDNSGGFWGKISAPFDFAKMTAGKLGTFIDMATINHNFFEYYEFTKYVRYLLLAGTLPLVVVISMKGTEILSNFF